MREDINKPITVSEAAEWASVSEWTIHKALNRGDLDGYRLGDLKGKRTTIAYLRKWIAANPAVPPKYRRSA